MITPHLTTYPSPDHLSLHPHLTIYPSPYSTLPSPPIPPYITLPSTQHLSPSPYHLPLHPSTQHLPPPHIYLLLPRLTQQMMQYIIQLCLNIERGNTINSLKVVWGPDDYHKPSHLVSDCRLSSWRQEVTLTFLNWLAALSSASVMCGARCQANPCR